MIEKICVRRDDEWQDDRLGVGISGCLEQLRRNFGRGRKVQGTKTGPVSQLIMIRLTSA